MKILQDLEVRGNISTIAGTDGSHVINKQQFETVINDLRNRNDSKPSVRATLGTIDLMTATVPSGPLTTDTGVSVVEGDRVLLVFPGVEASNGPFVVETETWSRADDGDISNQTNWRVEQGSDAGVAYVVTTAGTIIPGTTPFTIVPIASSILIDTESSPMQLGFGGSGLYINEISVEAAINASTNFASYRMATVVAPGNIDLESVPTTIDDVAIQFFPISSETGYRPDPRSSVVILANQSDPNENCIAAAIDDNGDRRLIRYFQGIWYVKYGTSTGETWVSNEEYNSLRRLTAKPHKETLLGGSVGTVTITHNLKTTRPFVRLFDLDTNSQIAGALPSNITLNSYDLVLGSLANDTEVVTMITPDN